MTRQLHYSSATPHRSVDLALFVNGIPVATAELKSAASQQPQTVEDAKEQYRKDRDPADRFFARRTLVHFAVDEDVVFLATRLRGDRTAFLPFNQGTEGRATPAVPATRCCRPAAAQRTAPRTCGSGCGSPMPGWTC